MLRLRDGEAVGATDGRGGYVPCVFRSPGGLTALGPVVVTPRPAPALTVGFVPVKGDRPEWAVQKLTELGVDRIVLLSSARSVIRWEGFRLESHLDRLRRVARSAVMQSRQVWVPEIAGLVSLEAALSSLGSGSATGSGSGFGSGSAAGATDPAPGAATGLSGTITVADPAGRPLLPSIHTVLIGPEGGWSDDERDLFARRNTALVSFGPSVLRAETAAVTAGVLMTALRGGLVRPVPD